MNKYLNIEHGVLNCEWDTCTFSLFVCVFVTLRVSELSMPIMTSSLFRIYVVHKNKYAYSLLFCQA